MKRHLTLMCVLLSLLFYHNVKAQEIEFVYKDKSIKAYKLQEIQKIGHNQNVMEIYFKDGKRLSMNTSTIQKIQYKSSVSSNEDILKQPPTDLIAMYPNPTTDYLNVRFSFPQNNVFRLSIYDSFGNEILKKSIESISNQECLETFDVSTLHPGLYIFRVQGSSMYYSERIIKI